MTALLLWLLTQFPANREEAPHDITVAEVATTVWTHACVTGTLKSRRRESDGDYHLRIEDAGSFIIAEVMPQIPLQIPKVGSRVYVCGVTRYDKLHRWYELHPVTSIFKRDPK